MNYVAEKDFYIGWGLDDDLYFAFDEAEIDKTQFEVPVSNLKRPAGTYSVTKTSDDTLMLSGNGTNAIWLSPNELMILIKVGLLKLR